MTETYPRGRLLVEGERRRLPIPQSEIPVEPLPLEEVLWVLFRGLVPIYVAAAAALAAWLVRAGVAPDAREPEVMVPVAIALCVTCPVTIAFALVLDPLMSERWWQDATVRVSWLVALAGALAALLVCPIAGWMARRRYRRTS
jgi:hypothetical protein